MGLSLESLDQRLKEFAMQNLDKKLRCYSGHQLRQDLKKCLFKVHHEFRACKTKGKGKGQVDSEQRSIANADAPRSWKPPSFDKSQVRLLVFRDCEPQGKKLLFDSKAIRVVQDNDETDSPCRVFGAGKFAQPVTRQSSKEGSTSQNSTGFKYQYLRPGSDVKLLGEMMFGSIALSYQGSTLKIHNIRVPPQLMLTKVFTVKPVKETSLEDSCDSHDLLTGPKTILNLSNRSSSGSASVAHSMPMAVPKSPGPENQREDDDSGIVASAASNNSMVTPFPSPSSSFSSTNSNSFHRRFMRSQATSMEYGLMRRCSGDFSGFSNTDDSLPSPPTSGCSRGRSVKIGVAVIISLPESDEESSRQFQKFFFSHFTLLETHMHKLGMGVERALRKTSQLFIQRCIETLDTFREDVWHLYTAVRIQEPVWLNMMSYSKQRRRLVEHFLQELIVTMDHCNNKTTNYFLSTLLTAVLTHHLAWVPTVTPAGATPPSRTYLDKHSSKTLDMLAKTHPYNPLWAQLSDLYGAIGYPIKLARTVVTGRKAELVNRLLYLLSYFIRCSEVNENSEERDEAGESEGKPELRSCLVCGEESDAEYILVSKEEEGFTSGIDFGCSGNDTDEPNDRLTPQRRDSNESNNNSVVCRESPTHLQESRLENVSHVQRISPRFERMDALVDVAASSTLSVSKEGGMVSPTRQLDEKEKYRYARMASKEGSISMLDEYFDGETEAKTIDDIQDELIRQSQEEERTACDKHGESDRHLQRTAQDGMSELSRPVTLGGIDICEVESHGRAFLSPDALSPVDEVPTPVVSCAGTPVPAPCVSPVSGGTTPATPLSTSPRTTTTSPAIPKAGQGGAVTTQAFTDAMFEGSTDSTLTNTSFCTSCESNRTARVDTPTPVQVDQGDGVFSWKGEEEEGVVSALPGEGADSDRKMSSCSSHGDQQEVLPDDLPMPRSKSVQNPQQRLESNFGRSLLAGYSEKYLSDFVLLGTGESDFRQKLQTDLQLATQTSILDEPIAEAVCIVADTDRWTVQLYSSQKRGDKPAADVMGSSQVNGILQSVANLYKLKMPAEFCLMHLEDRLQELFFKSKMLAEYLRGHTRVTIQELSACVGIESSDLPLLTAVASTHSPHVAMSLV